MSTWNSERLQQTEMHALKCDSDDACRVDVVLLIGEVRRLRAAITDALDHHYIKGDGPAGLMRLRAAVEE